jgi:hypothetical protein
MRTLKNAFINNYRIIFHIFGTAIMLVVTQLFGFHELLEIGGTSIIFQLIFIVGAYKFNQYALEKSGMKQIIQEEKELMNKK